MMTILKVMAMIKMVGVMNTEAEALTMKVMNAV